jgi:endogenous inhibitor of DNA gyrase (YacG/DUF329 family)
MRKITEEQLISELRECFEKHGRVNRKIFNEDEDFSSGKTIYNKFGSFANACDEAEVPHDNKPQEKDKVKVECENCGKSKEVYPYRLNENSNKRFFCDNKCQGNWWSENLTGEDHPLYMGGGEWSNKLGAKWHKYRDKCLERDEYECRVCGKTQSKHIEEHDFGLDVHHIEPRRNFYKDEERSIDESNKMENLITLCREHHVKAENGNIDLEVV